MTYFKNKTVIMSGGSRGVGLEIAKALGKDGANIAILAKTTEPHPTLPGTIFTAAEEIEQVGGNALPIVCDIRYEEQVEAAVDLLDLDYDQQRWLSRQDKEKEKQREPPHQQSP